MPDRFKYAKVRQEIINALKTDLMGPQSADEVLDENPKSAYIIGMLASQTEDKDTSTAGEQEVDSDIAYGDSDDYTAVSYTHLDVYKRQRLGVLFLLMKLVSEKL